MAYTAEKPNLVPDSNELRSRIVGWGVDLDPRDRPAVPKERFNPEGTGAHWDFPERQPEKYPRERSPEHKFLTPVFGTSCPPRGVSGAIRRYAYRFSEGRTAHWMLLVLADRVDAMGSALLDLVRGRPDNYFAEMGLGAEFRRHGLRSRLGQRRADVKHLPIDVLMFAGRGAVVAAGAFAIGRALFNAASGRRRKRASLRWLRRR